MPELILAIDVGTTSTRAAVVAPGGRLAGLAAAPLTSSNPRPGLVEQDAARVWAATRRVIALALERAGRAAADIGAVGVTTQRASAVAWDRRTGRPLAPMVVWSDLRGAAEATKLQQAAAKLEALIAETPDARALAASGRLAVGNIDAFLVFKLSGGVHATDRSQAWPMGYLDLASMGWNRALLELQGIDEALLPRLVDTWGAIGTTTRAAFAAQVPIAAIVADQQSALIGHGAEEAGAVKVTYGTSATLDAGTGGGFVFAGMSTPPFVVSHVRGQTRFCLEGMVFSAGSAVDWVRRTMRLGDHARFEALAASIRDAGGAAFLPALHGLGAPHGDPTRRAALTGLSGSTGPAQIARAALEGVAFRVREILDHITGATELPAPTALLVDGGLAASDTLLQIQADITGLPVARHALRDAAACGAAIGAGRGTGLLKETDVAAFTQHDRIFEPAIGPDEANARHEAWRAQVYR